MWVTGLFLFIRHRCWVFTVFVWGILSPQNKVVNVVVIIIALIAGRQGTRRLVTRNHIYCQKIASNYPSGGLFVPFLPPQRCLLSRHAAPPAFLFSIGNARCLAAYFHVPARI
jgi:hypothetical protein